MMMKSLQRLLPHAERCTADLVPSSHSSGTWNAGLTTSNTTEDTYRPIITTITTALDYVCSHFLLAQIGACNEGRSTAQLHDITVLRSKYQGSWIGAGGETAVEQTP